MSSSATSFIIKENDTPTFSFKIDETLTDQNTKTKNNTLLGKGGFGKVFICNYIENGVNDAIKSCIKDPICLKIMSKKLVKPKDISKEIEIFKKINSVDELKKYGLEYKYFCETNLEYLLFTERLDMDLEQYVKNSAYSKENNAYICDKLLRGLTAFHKHGLYHHDIKPANIMITINDKKVEKVKYIDFGLSCNEINNYKNNYKNNCSNYGTPYYLCPLIIDTQLKYDNYIPQKIDRFALGMTFFFLLNENNYFEYHKAHKNIKYKNLNQYDIYKYYEYDLINKYDEVNKKNIENEKDLMKYIEKHNKPNDTEKYWYLPIYDLLNYTKIMKPFGPFIQPKTIIDTIKKFFTRKKRLDKDVVIRDNSGVEE